MKHQGLIFIGILYLLISCGGNPTTDESQSTLGPNLDGLQSLNAITGLQLVSPTSSPNSITTPTLRASGLRTGDRLSIYSDSNCSLLTTSEISSGTTHDLTLPALSIGVYTFYAQRSWDSVGLQSPCSSVFVSYSVIGGVALNSFIEPADGTYADGANLLFQASFAEAMNVVGFPQILIDVGGVPRQATYSGGTGTAAIEFTYTIQPGENDADGITVTTSSIDLNSGSMTAVSDGDLAALDYSAFLDPTTGVLVNTASGITAPDQVVGVASGPTTVNTTLALSWSVPNDNGTTINQYVVQYRQQGSPTWLNLTPSPTVNSATVTGLSSGVTYEIRVAADNGLLGPYSAVSTAEVFDILSLNPIAWLSSTNITNGGTEPLNNDLIASWQDLTGLASPATEANPANQPTYVTNFQNGLPVVRFNNLDRGLEGSFTRTVGTDLTFIVVGFFDTGSVDKCLFEFKGPGSERGFFIDRRYASNVNYVPASTKNALTLWRIEDAGGNATVTENGLTQLFSGGTSFNTDFTGAGTYVLGDDTTGGNRLNGYIAEFLIFDRALSAQDIQDLETYLQTKWGLP